MKKKPKVFPMDGPPLLIQNIMQSPLANRAELEAWLRDNPNHRNETRAAIISALARGR
jgi:hypothetical protein